MKNTFLKLTKETKDKIVSKIATKEIADLLIQMKENKEKKEEDFGTFKMIVSTATVDRAGEVVDQAGWDFSHYKNNPVVLWGHDYDIPPIGITDNIYTDAKGQTIAEGRFAPTEFAQQIRQLYDAGIQKASSVGFIVKEMDGKTITKAELIEWSFVTVPANPEALSIAKELGLDTSVLQEKGIFATKQGEVVDNTENTDNEEKKEDEKEPVTEENDKDDETHEDDEKQQETQEIDEQEEENEDIEEKTLENDEKDDEKKSIEVEIPKNLTKKQRKAIEEKIKGAIEDELTRDLDDYWKKWDMIDHIEPIIYTFYDVFFRNSTPSSDFEKLMNEMIYLLGKAIEEAKVEEKSEIIEQSLGQYQTQEVKKMVKATEDAKLEQKVGAHMQEMQNEVDDAIVRHAQDILEIIKDEEDTEEKKLKLSEAIQNIQKTIGVVSEKSEDVVSHKEVKKERSKSVEFNATMKSLDDYINMQKILRAVANATTKGLEDINKKISKKRIKK